MYRVWGLLTWRCMYAESKSYYMYTRLLSIFLSSSLDVAFVSLRGFSTGLSFRLCITSEARKPCARAADPGRYVASSLGEFHVAGSEQITCSFSEHAAATRRSRRKNSSISGHPAFVDIEQLLLFFGFDKEKFILGHQEE